MKHPTVGIQHDLIRRNGELSIITINLALAKKREISQDLNIRNGI
jgi:hypothetical protein